LLVYYSFCSRIWNHCHLIMMEGLNSFTCHDLSSLASFRLQCIPATKNHWHFQISDNRRQDECHRCRTIQILTECKWRFRQSACWDKSIVHLRRNKMGNTKSAAVIFTTGRDVINPPTLFSFFFFKFLPYDPVTSQVRDTPTHIKTFFSMKCM
jgi:hypothetical protein